MPRIIVSSQKGRSVTNLETRAKTATILEGRSTPITITSLLSKTPVGRETLPLEPNLLVDEDDTLMILEGGELIIIGDPTYMQIREDYGVIPYRILDTAGRYIIGADDKYLATGI